MISWAKKQKQKVEAGARIADRELFTSKQDVDDDSEEDSSSSLQVANGFDHS